MDDRIGSLVPGKEADMVAIDLGRIESLPLYDPQSQVVYASRRDQVTDVWVAGRQLLKARELQTLDMEEIMARAGEGHARICGEN